MDDKPQLWLPKAGENGMTVLHYAAYCQDLAGVRHWVEQGFDVNQKDDGGWTPLVWCIDMAATGAVGAAEAIVDYLVQHGAQLEYKDDTYGSLLEFARSRDTFIAEHLERRHIVQVHNSVQPKIECQSSPASATFIKEG